MTESNRRLDKSHGFMKVILKNQIERDEYHRGVTEINDHIKRELRSTTKPRANREVKAQLYTPPHLRNKSKLANNDHSPSTSNDNDIDEQDDNPLRKRIRQRLNKELTEKKQTVSGLASNVPASSPAKSGNKVPLFILQFEDLQGEVHECVVYEGDSPPRLAKIFCQKLNLPEESAAHIRQHIEEKMTSLRSGSE